MWKYKTFTFINIAGMAVAFGAALLLALTAFFELSYDSFHKNKADVYQLYFEQHHANSVDKGSAMPIPITPTLKDELPDVAHITRYGDFGGSALRYGDKVFNYDIRCVDADFFKMFTFPIISGSHESPLADKNDVVLSAKVAKNIFGNQNPIGKLIEVKLNNEWKSLNVTAIAADAPENSSLSFGLLCRFEQFPGYDQNLNDWNNQSHDVFVQLPADADPLAFEKKLRKFTAKHYEGTIKQLIHDGATRDNNGDVLSLHLIPLTDVHFNAISSQSRAVSKFYPYLVLLISVFILFIACTNFINLSLGRAFTRAKEIGVRKVIGATKTQLIIQFCSESFIICGVSLLLGALAACILLPQYKQAFNQQLSLDMLKSPVIIGYFLGGFALISVLAGAYPAWVMAIRKTALTVKGKVSSNQSNGLRNTLMVVQFTLSGLLIICTAITWQQLSYMRNKSLGYNKSEVISIPIGSNIDPDRALSLMRSRLSSNTQVVSVTGTNMNLGEGLDNSSSTSIMSFNYKDKTVSTNWTRVDEDYVKTLGLQLISGHDFSGSYASDTSVVLINQKMAQQLGEKDPIGDLLPTDGSKLQVAGIIKDFNFRSLHHEIGPLTMVIRKGWPVGYLLVKVKNSSLNAGMSLVTATWKGINPRAEYNPSFLDENTERQYNKETDLSKIFVSGAVISIVISCMGLFAIVILIITQRTKEIGIRKVLGASVNNILLLISKDFLKLVLLSICIASPIAWYAMNKWLQDFAYSIKIEWWVFVLTGLIALAIAFVTISFQSIKAALVNPVKSLRSE
jgi:ABC-type antimicrobial peptide transport system permease subunit